MKQVIVSVLHSIKNQFFFLKDGGNSSNSYSSLSSDWLPNILHTRDKGLGKDYCILGKQGICVIYGDMSCLRSHLHSWLVHPY